MEPTLQAVYGEEQPDVVISELPADGVKTKDIRRLILSLAHVETMPKWISVKNAPLIPRVVILACQGLNASLFKRFKASHAPFLASMTMVPTSAPGSGKRINSPLIELMSRTLTSKMVAQQAPVDPGGWTVVPGKGQPEGVLGPCGDNVRAMSDALMVQRAYFLCMKRAELVSHGFPVVLSQAEKNDMHETSANACDGYLPTPSPVDGEQRHAMVSIDCEMVRCGERTALAWVAVVARDGTVLLDALVKPEWPVTDYLTQWSGVTPRRLEGVTTTRDQARALLFNVIDSHTFLCGHSLENDLHALGVIHDRVMDTSVLYPRSAGSAPQFKHALRFLCRKYLERSIQDGASHSPVEDARATMDLVTLKVLRGTNFGVDVGAKATENIVLALEREGRAKCTVIDTARNCSKYTQHSSADAIPCATDTEVQAALLGAVAKPVEDARLSIVWAQLHTLSQMYGAATEELQAILDQDPSRMGVPGEWFGMHLLKHQAEYAKAVQLFDTIARETYDALPRGSLLVIPTLQGNASLVKAWYGWKTPLEEANLWSPMHDNGYMTLVARARAALTFFAVKH